MSAPLTPDTIELFPPVVVSCQPMVFPTLEKLIFCTEWDLRLMFPDNDYNSIMVHKYDLNQEKLGDIESSKKYCTGVPVFSRLSSAEYVWTLQIYLI